MTTAVIYARISADDGRALGVARQEADCRALCDTRGWAVAEVIVDNDLSAFSGKRRPGYEALLDGLRVRRWDVLVTWHPDRLHRRPVELEEFIEVVETSGVQVSTITAGEIDLATPDGRLMARIVGSVARKESEDKSRRIRRKHLELAEQGMPSGGGRPFGYTADRLDLVPEEAAEIRAAVDRLLAGASLRSVLYDWRDRLPTVTGGRWSRGTVERIVMSPRIAGLREHRGETVGPGQWPAIITPDEHLRLRAMFSTTRPATVRSYLLTGWVYCGECGERLGTRPTAGRRRYVCTRDTGGCEAVGINAPALEALVAEQVIGHLDRAPFPDVTPPDLGPLRAVEDRLVELAAMWAAGEIGRAEWAAARQALEGRQGALMVPSEPLVVTGDAGAEWEEADLDRRRTMVASVVERVVIAKASPRAGRFDPGRVTVEWR